jgi:hypothetical protein
MATYRVFGYETVQHEVEFIVEADSAEEAQEKVLDGDFEDSILGEAVDYFDGLKITSVTREN